MGQGQNTDTNLFFEKARGITQTVLPTDHDVFGNLAMAMDDLATQRKQEVAALGYCKQASVIYIIEFPASHWKVKAAKQEADA